MPEEPAGKVITRSAGAVEVWASMEWQSPTDVPREDLLPTLPEGIKSSILEAPSPEETSRTIEGEMRGFDLESMAEALDGVLEALTSGAALSEAVLETRVAWLVPPLAPPAALVGRVGRELWSVGLGVTFGPSWTPIVGADIAIGVGGCEGELESFLPAGYWEITPRRP